MNSDGGRHGAESRDDGTGSRAISAIGLSSQKTESNDEGRRVEGLYRKA
jgi:hypothetical protein